MKTQKKILIVDDDREVADLVELTLTREQYQVIRTGNGLVGYKMAKTHLPDLIIMDVVMPGMDGMTLCQKIRRDKNLRFVPVIILTGSRVHPNDKIAGLSIGADEYLLKPFIPQELSVRVKSLLKRTEEHLSVNPLTKLPGSYTLEGEVSKLIESQKIFALCYFDLDHFKAFNDSYNYSEGDKVIRYLASLITNTVTELGNEDDFVAHIGGDDFVMVTSPEKVDKIYKKVISSFNADINKFYSGQDIEKGSVTTTNRKGIKEEFPLMTITAAAASNENRKITHYAQFVDILSELKRYAKTKQGHILVNDRRRDAAVK